MKLIRLMLMGMGSLALLATLAVLPGCEKDKDGSDISAELNDFDSDPRNAELTSGGLALDPTSANVARQGQTVLFTVTAGGRRPYAWSVADATAGSIETQEHEQQAIYTCLIVRENNVTVRDQDGRTAIAGINRSVSTLSMSPSSANLTAISFTARFTAVGGTAPYAFNLVYGSLGSVTAVGANQVDYTQAAGHRANTTNENQIVVIDADGSTASASIKFQDP